MTQTDGSHNTITLMKINGGIQCYKRHCRQIHSEVQQTPEHVFFIPSGWQLADPWHFSFPLKLKEPN